MGEVKTRLFEFDPPPKKPSPLEARLQRIATTGEITRSIATAKLPHKKAKDAPYASVVVQTRTVTDTKELFVGALEEIIAESAPAATDRKQNKDSARNPRSQEKQQETKETRKDPEVKRVFEPTYNWPCKYPKDREARALPEEKLTTVLFGEGFVPPKKKKKQKKEAKGKEVLAIEAQKEEKVVSPAVLELPQYASQRSSSLHDLRLRQQVQAKVAHKVLRWRREVDALVATKQQSVAAERKRLIAYFTHRENEKLVKDFEEAKEKFEKQRKEVEETLKAVRGEREKEAEEEFNPVLPPARYPQSKAILKATEDVQKWFTTEVLSKHKLLVASEQWTSSAAKKASPAEVDLIYLTEVQATHPTKPVLKAEKAEREKPPVLEVEFKSPEDSFEEVQGTTARDSEDSFEDIS